MKNATTRLSYLCLLILISGLFFNTITSATAQTIDSNFFKYHLAQTSYALDTEASAMILYEKNTVGIDVFPGIFLETYKVYKIIKILKTDAFDCANIHLFYTSTGSGDNFIKTIHAATYNSENGQTIKTDLAKNDIYVKSVADNDYEVNLSLPNIKVGSIIEYSYEYSMGVGNVLPVWDIQDKYPKLKSVYEARFPEVLQFTSFTQIRVPFVEYHNMKTVDSLNPVSYHISIDRNRENTITWGRRNIPALKEEPYISSINNHRERMELQLTELTLGAIDQKFVSTWQKFDADFIENSQINQLARANNFLDDEVDLLTKSVPSNLDKAKAIFKYVRSKFTANNTRTIHTNKVLKTVFENKAGTEMEINLLLIAMMRKAGLNAAPVLLSTIGNPQVKEMFPTIDRFNYMVCAVKIDSNTILLDASGKYNAFNTLPSYCYNGYARLVDKKGEGLMLTPDGIKEKWVSSVRITDISEGGFMVNITEKFGKNMSARLREKWAKDEKGFKSFLNDQTQNYSGNANVTKSEALFLDDPDTSLVIKYSCRITSDKKNTIYYLSTNFIKFFDKNPFNATGRQLPVEFPSNMDYMCATTIQIPKDFELEEVPKPTELDYENEEMTYKKMANYDSSLHWLTINTHFVTNKTVYPVEGYETLREFFDKMTQEENDVVTLKKTENK